MMHRDDFVVTLRHGNSDTTLREFRNSDYADSDHRKYRYREVYIPYGSEYKFALKNIADVRRRVEISIDGSVVGGWVLSAGSRRNPIEAVIERFADTARKFKVVHPDHPDVADPGSADNGNIIVKVWREKKKYPLLIWEKEKKPWSTPPPPHYWQDNGTGDASFLRNRSFTSCCCTSAAMRSSRGSDLASRVDDGSAATIEGGRSNQQFGTTYWTGDEGAPLVFEFNIIGKGDPIDSELSKLEVRQCVFVQIKFHTIRDCGVTVKNSKSALEQLGLKILKTKNRGKTVEGYFPEGSLDVIEQLKGVAEVKVVQ